VAGTRPSPPRSRSQKVIHNPRSPTGSPRRQGTDSRSRHSPIRARGLRCRGCTRPPQCRAGFRGLSGRRPCGRSSAAGRLLPARHRRLPGDRNGAEWGSSSARAKCQLTKRHHSARPPRVSLLRSSTRRFAVTAGSAGPWAFPVRRVGSRSEPRPRRSANRARRHAPTASDPRRADGDPGPATLLQQGCRRVP
jgi:hypothetical protein